MRGYSVGASVSLWKVQQGCEGSQSTCCCPAGALSFTLFVPTKNEKSRELKNIFLLSVCVSQKGGGVGARRVSTNATVLKAFRNL
jgi:hypothetical protein